jgi:small subunit ribosomal protein S1
LLRGKIGAPPEAPLCLKEAHLSFMIHMQDVMAKPMPDFREGSIVKGRILEIRPREVLVDVGYKSEGVISLAEFDDVESLEVGDEVDVLLERL